MRDEIPPASPMIDTPLNVSSGNASPVAIEELRSLAAVAGRCRDQIFDLLVRLSQHQSLEGMSQGPDVINAVWQSLHDDPGPFMMSLDFLMTVDGPRLARVVGPWACLPQGMQQDRNLRGEVSKYLLRRFGPQGTLSIRTIDFGNPYGDGRLMARTAIDAGFDAQWADLSADWSDAPELKGAWIQAPLIASYAGYFERPPDSVPLFSPLWTSLLDEPGLMVYLRRVYPQEVVYLDAWFAANGRTIHEQTGISMSRVAGVVQDLGEYASHERLDLVRFFVDDQRILGCSMLRDAQIRFAASGVVTGVEPTWPT